MKNNVSKIAIIGLLWALVSFCPTLLSAESNVNEQLTINFAMLSSGTDEQIRAVAAKQLLIAPEQEASDMVVSALSDAKNANSVKAICEAISESDQWDADIFYPDSYITPLITILKSGDSEVAQHAASALAVYPYEQIADPIKQMLYDEQNSQQARLNAIFAIGLRLSEKQAIAEMISLLDDGDPVVADQAGKTLQGWVPMGTNKDLWNYVRSELKQKSPDEIVRDRLAAQEMRVQKLNQEKQQLTSELVEAYEQLYQTKTDTAGKSAFLTEALKNKVDEIRLWAVKKIALWRNGTELSDELTVAVVNVINDPYAEVRYEAAKLLVYMADADPTAKLVEQLKNEEVDKVQTALLEALAESAYYALLPSSEIKLAPEVRTFTLDKASEFLKGKEAERVVVGGEVIRKMLEKNGLADETAQKYINNVLERYRLALDNNMLLAGRLLNVMSKYVLSDFHYRTLARKAFEPLFVEALSSNLVDVRKAAVEGLVNIDKATALKVLAEKQIYNDPDAAIVKMVIDLAREVGGGKDYIWLTEKVKQGTEGAWAAVIAILQREDVSIVDKAVAGIDSYEIDDAKKIEVFEIGRKKAGIQYKSTILLAHFYLDRSKFTEAADLYAWLLADTAGKSEAVNDAENALKAFAAAGKEDQIVSLVALMLNSGDIQPEGAAAAVLQNAVKSSKSGLKDKLIKITVPEPRPGWQKLAQGWKEPPVSTAKEPASPAKSPAPEQKQPEAKPAAETAAAAKPAQPQS